MLGLQLFSPGNQPLPQARRNAARRVPRGAKRLPGLAGTRSIRCAGEGGAILTETFPTEHEEQCDFVRWFRRKFADVRIFAIPNGGYRSQAAGAKLKAEGASAGVPDLFVPAWRLWIEMKRQKGGRVSPEQTDWIAYLESLGHTCIVCPGSENAQAQVDAFAATIK
jgi:hypothetical protein